MMRFRFASAVVVTVAALVLPGVALGVAGPTTFTFTGGEQSYAVPGGVQLLGVLVQGAWSGRSSGFGENGAGVEGFLPVGPGETLYEEVGQNGSYGGAATFGGGGAAGAPPPTLSGGVGEFADAGGGASDVRTCSRSAVSCPAGGSSLGSRMIVAGGGGGDGGGGNSNSPTCAGPDGFGGGADNPQPLPGGDAAAGALPVITAAGIVIPGFATADHHSAMTTSGTTDAAFGTSAGGAGGMLSGCSSGSGNPTITYSHSVAGSSGSAPSGGTGGDASGLEPFSGGGCTGTQCADAGPGGGGGGGYFGGGGGATGYDTCVSSPGGACNDAGSGQGGAGGSSFSANQVQYPRVDFAAMGTGVPFVRFVPAIEIDSPANGAVYSAGQVVDAAWSCVGTDPVSGLTVENCTGSAASGSPVDSSVGTHTFTVHGMASNAGEPVSASITYTVTGTSGGGPGAGGGGSGGNGGSGSSPTATARGAAGGLTFVLSLPTSCLAPGAGLPVSLAKSGSSKTYRPGSYSYYIDRGRPHRVHVTVHGKRTTKTVYLPTLVTRRAGSVTLPTGHLSPGAHTVRLVTLLRAIARSHRPKTKTVTVSLTFTVC